MGLSVCNQRGREGLGGRLRRCPRQRSDRVGTDHDGSPPATDRQHPLRGKLGTRSVNGELLDQWQYEVTGGGRLWYCIDDKRHLVWLTGAMTGHPKVTE